ncbi:hypothetical protein GCM10023235_02950 [Kitasatospora terrestris]|uniref:Uncharacterized protein n=1 Tax=Kitasatospora terrestris TaxID=258051 RepID=A0ABP9D7S8_9ACTN
MQREEGERLHLGHRPQPEAVGGEDLQDGPHHDHPPKCSARPPAAPPIFPGRRRPREGRLWVPTGGEGDLHPEVARAPGSTHLLGREITGVVSTDPQYRLDLWAALRLAPAQRP